MPDRQAGGAKPADPIAQFVESMADAWSRGLQAWGALAGIGTDTGGLGGAGIMAALANRLERLAAAAGSAVAGGGSGPTAEAGQAALAQAADMLPALAEAYLAGAASAVRYWTKLAELLARTEASLVQAAADRATGKATVSVAECRILADELRALLREVGEAAMQEATRLQHDLERAGESIAQAADRATPSPHPDDPRRRHEAKP